MGRPVRGLRQSAFYSVDPHPSLATLDSAFQLQEYISLLVRLDPHDVQRIVALPGSRKEEQQEEERPVVDEACWIYEQLRRLAQDLTHPLITTLQLECSRQSCPEMKAGEWLYLCVAHGNSGGMEHCCAIDYIVHTLDSATALLNSPRAFPSRISIPPTSHRHFPSLARRLGRIFAHAYHHHRAAFETAEAEGALYARFLALARRFDLVPAEFLVIPPRPSDPDPEPEAQPPRVTLLARERERDSPEGSPRIGGRARTDTMYLSDGFPGTLSAGPAASPRRIPSPMAGTLFAEQHAEDAVAAAADVPEKSRVYARDFALPQEAQPRRDVSETEAEAERKGMQEQEEEEEEAQDYDEWEPEPPPVEAESVAVPQSEDVPQEPREPDAQDEKALTPEDAPEHADDAATMTAALEDVSREPPKMPATKDEVPPSTAPAEPEHHAPSSEATSPAALDITPAAPSDNDITPAPAPTHETVTIPRAVVVPSDTEPIVSADDVVPLFEVEKDGGGAENENEKEEEGKGVEGEKDAEDENEKDDVAMDVDEDEHGDGDGNGKDGAAVEEAQPEQVSDGGASPAASAKKDDED